MHSERHWLGIFFVKLGEMLIWTGAEKFCVEDFEFYLFYGTVIWLK
jgi:hypothetical protein